MKRVIGPVVVVLGAAVAACGNPLDPTAEVDGLRFTGAAQVVLLPSPNFPEYLVQADVSVRNVSRFPIQRTYDGGCFIRRFQAFLHEGGQRRLAFDSDLDPNWGCTDDLAIVELAPREEARPHNWRAGIRLSRIRDSLPAGRYEIVIRIQAGDRILRAGFVDLE